MASTTDGSVEPAPLGRRAIAGTPAAETGFTRNARPAIVYAGLLFIFVVHVVLPTLAFCLGREDPRVLLPEGFWWAWSGVVSVWVAGRSYEKVSGVGSARAIVGG